MNKQPSADAEPHRDAPEKGQTLPRQNQQPVPQLPHERDESADSHPGTQDERVKQAARDLASGQQDTGRAAVVAQLAKQEFSSQDAAQNPPGEKRSA